MTTPDPIRWARLLGLPRPVDEEAHAQNLADWLHAQGFAGSLADDEHLPRDPITLDQWAQILGERPATVRDWTRRADWTARPRLRARWESGSGRRGRTPAIYSLSDLEASPRPRTRRIAPERYERGERLTLYAIAIRVGIDFTTLYQYRDHAGFPDPDGDGHYDARQVATWYNTIRPGRKGKLG